MKMETDAIFQVFSSINKKLLLLLIFIIINWNLANSDFAFFLRRILEIQRNSIHFVTIRLVFFSTMECNTLMWLIFDHRKKNPWCAQAHTYFIDILFIICIYIYVSFRVVAYPLALKKLIQPRTYAFHFDTQSITITFIKFDVFSLSLCIIYELDEVRMWNASIQKTATRNIHSITVQL